MVSNSAIPFKILVIDDEAAIRNSLAFFLEDYNFSVITAESGEKALAIIGEKRIDAAIVDLRLPGMSGEEFIQEARKRCPWMKFLIHTGSVDYRINGSMKKADIGIEDLFLKPLDDMFLMVEALNRLLS
jgi:DNA-binding response OmpR family regulator